MKLELENKYELIAMHRVFFEAKYHGEWNDVDIQASPFVRDIYERIFSLLMNELDENEVQRWKKWRELENHEGLIDNLKARLKRMHNSRWPKEDDKKNSFIECLCCPLIPNRKQMDELINFGNQIHGNC